MWGSGAVLGVGDVLEPGHDLAVGVGFLDGHVGHEPVGGGPGDQGGRDDRERHLERAEQHERDGQEAEEVVAALRDPDVVLLLAGSGDRVELYRSTARTLGLDRQVRFLRRIQNERLPPVYAAADVVVHPSYAETFGMVVVEALARGLPVIATAVGGVPDALGRTADGRRPGLLVPPRDPRALSAALSSWLNDPALRRRLQHAARERRTTLTRWSTTADQVAQVLAQVAARSGDH